MSFYELQQNAIDWLSEDLAMCPIDKKEYY